MFGLFKKRLFCAAPEWIARAWPSVLLGASFRVQVAKREVVEDVEYSTAGIVSHQISNSGYAHVYLKHTSVPPSPQIKWKLECSGTMFSSSVIRMLLSCGCQIPASSTRQVCHSMFSCRLDDSLGALVQSRRWRVYPDCRDKRIMQLVEPLVSANLDLYLQKSWFTPRSTAIAIGLTERCGPYFAVCDGSVIYQDWLGNPADRDLEKECIRQGFHKLPILATLPERGC